MVRNSQSPKDVTYCTFSSALSQWKQYNTKMAGKHILKRKIAAWILCNIAFTSAK